MYRLLIVAADEDVRESIRYLVDWNQYDISSVLTVSSYGEAVNSIMDFLPHIALVDVELGEYRGYELAANLRDTGANTVFCMMSGREDFHYVRNAMRAGAKDFLLTPINAKELRAFLERTIVRDLRGTIPDRPISQPEVDPVLQVEYTQLSRITAKIILIVKSNYRRSQSLTSIAETLNMSSKYIGRIFLKDTGMKFSEYLTNYRMIQARRLIENTQEKISVVASMVGYSQLNNSVQSGLHRLGHRPARHAGNSHQQHLQQEKVQDLPDTHVHAPLHELGCGQLLRLCLPGHGQGPTQLPHPVLRRRKDQLVFHALRLAAHSDYHAHMEIHRLQDGRVSGQYYRH
ncbi:MAG: response regulator [Oscillospiraceae bacterium]|nr:response regulator [Oscillospiraceae bacterium]